MRFPQSFRRICSTSPKANSHGCIGKSSVRAVSVRMPNGEAGLTSKQANAVIADARRALGDRHLFKVLAALQKQEPPSQQKLILEIIYLILISARPILRRPLSAVANVGCPVQRFAMDLYQYAKRICASRLPIDVDGRIRFHILLAKWSHARM